MVEQTNQSEHSFVKGELNGGRTGQTCIEDYSYDKDVVEIKLPDTVVSSDYGGHFVKDVCIDEGVFPDKKTSTEKLVDQKVSINFDSSEDTNSDLGEEIRADSTKTALELKSQLVILPVMCATDGNTGEQNTLCKECNLEDNNTATVSTDSNEKPNAKQSLHEGAQGCQQVGSVISKGNENLEPFFNGEAAHQVYYYLTYNTTHLQSTLILKFVHPIDVSHKFSMIIYELLALVLHLQFIWFDK